MADMLFECGPPENEAEADTVVDHGEPAAGKPGRADKLAGDVVAGNGRPPFPSTLGGERLAGAVDIAGLQPLEQVLDARIRPSPRSVA